MKTYQVRSSQGSFGANNGCEKAPELICPNRDWVAVVEDNIEETNKVLEQIDLGFFVGGDHSITYPLFNSFAAKHKNPCLVIFDAHADCSDDFMPPTHEDFNKVLINQGALKPENLLLIGLRKIYDHEREFLNEKGVKFIEMQDLPSAENLIKQIREFTKDKDAYVSIDIDVLDKKFAPGTGYVEKSQGMELDYLLETLNGIKGLIKKGDLVEINPDKDVEGKTVEAGKKILSIIRPQ
jgi:arginase family enzyme